MGLPISAIVLTYNEEKNIETCLKSLSGLVTDVYIIDSYSTDKTIEIAKSYTSKIFQHKFENWGRQRNWAMDNLPISTEWVFHLDSDHSVSEKLRNEIVDIFSSGNHEQYDGFLISRKTIFMNKWIKHGGHYPVYHAVLFKKNNGRCEEAIYDQHFIVSGDLKILNGDIEDRFTETLPIFMAKHKRWATFEAINYLMHASNKNKRVKADLSGSPIEKRRYLKGLYFRLPIFIRPVLYFIYRYFIKLGFIDGIPGFVFHVMQGFWFRFLVDCKICGIKIKAMREKKDVQMVAKELIT